VTPYGEIAEITVVDPFLDVAKRIATLPVPGINCWSRTGYEKE
jgi:hypothetical protein